jgi:hypothetical protein
MYLLPESDLAMLSAIALARLTEFFPVLFGCHLSIAKAVLHIDCPRNGEAAEISDDDVLGYFVYLITGCDSFTVSLQGVQILNRSQLHLIQLSEGVEMAAKTQQAPAATFDIDVLARAIATAIRETLNPPEAPMIAVEPPPVAPTSKEATPKSLNIRIPRGAFTPAKSNWMQSAKRYLKAVDPTGEDQVLEAIVGDNDRGRAHLNKALSYLPKAERAAAREKFYQGFVKVKAEREKA